MSSTKKVCIQFDTRMTEGHVNCETSKVVVRSFIDFLTSVEPTTDHNTQALKIAKIILKNLFELDPSSLGSPQNPSMVGLFESSDDDAAADDDNEDGDGENGDSGSDPEPPLLMGEDVWTTKLSTLGISKGELIDRCFTALEKMKCINTTIGGSVARVTRLFQDAFMEMEKYECDNVLNNLADSLRAQGNRAMRSKQYKDAIKLYTCAISLCENTAVYYCNRAAALIEICEYDEAIRDCEKAIQLDPNYTDAYGRLGSAYYAQGSYQHSIDKGFKKALQLDPGCRTLKNNARMAEYKLANSSSRNPTDSSLPDDPKQTDLILEAADISPPTMVKLWKLLLAGGVVDGSCGFPRPDNRRPGNRRPGNRRPGNRRPVVRDRFIKI